MSNGGKISTAKPVMPMVNLFSLVIIEKEIKLVGLCLLEDILRVKKNQK